MLPMSAWMSWPTFCSSVISPSSALMRVSRAASGGKAGGLSGHIAGWIVVEDSAARSTPDSNGPPKSRPKSIFIPSRMHLSSMDPHERPGQDDTLGRGSHGNDSAVNERSFPMLEQTRLSHSPDGLQAKRAVDSVVNISDLPDLLLVERTRGRDTRAFETLMRRYNRRLYRISRSILSNDDMAEEAVRAAYIRAFANLDRYEPAGKFGAWLARLAFNEALTYAGTHRARCLLQYRRRQPRLHRQRMTPLRASNT